MTLSDLRARYDLRVFQPGAVVRLPLRAEGADLPPGGALLDGQAIEPRWAPDTTLTLEVPEPGRHQLELSLRPTLRSSETTGGFDMTIPRVPTARLVLSLPADAPPVEVPVS